MKLNKSSVLTVLIAILATLILSSVVRDVLEKQEKRRLENILGPIVAKSVEGTAEPKPKLAFVSATDKSLVLVLIWEQKPEAAIKNDMRERVSTLVRKELSADPSLWGSRISVIFSDEVVLQAWK